MSETSTKRLLIWCCSGIYPGEPLAQCIIFQSIGYGVGRNEERERETKRGGRERESQKEEEDRERKEK